MTLFGMFVCAAVLFAVGYFAFAVVGEVALWAYSRLNRQGSPIERQTTTAVINRKFSI